jgi:hypothetical protein
VAPAARSSGPFPDASLRDLEGAMKPLREAWRDGEALVLIGHGDCSTTRFALPFFERLHRRHTRASLLLVLQDGVAAARQLRAELDLTLPIRLEPAPYALAADLGIEAVPTLLLVGRDGQIVRVSEGFDRDAFESLAERVGVDGPLFTASDRAPAFRPG